MVQTDRKNSQDSPKMNNTNPTDNFAYAQSRNKEREEYMQSLQQWIYEARIWQSAAMHFPYYMMGFHATDQTTTIPNSSGQQLQPNQNNRNFRQLFHTNVRRGPPISTFLQSDYTSDFIKPTKVPCTLSSTEGLEFIIPPVWKRILAECVDFVILFIAKLVMTLIALELLDKSDWGIFNLPSNTLDFSLDSDFTNGLLILEALHRIMVCVYEIYWLHGTNEFRFGCATPGKALMGLTVIVATKIKDMEPNNPNSTKVLIYPGKDLGYLIAAGRAFIKNVLLALMFPFCFAIFLFQFNRTGYDVMCNTLVVEYDPDPPKRTWPV